MRAATAGLLSCLVAVTAACAGGDSAPSRAQEADEILAITTPLDASTTRLRRLDPATLAPRGGGLDLGEYHDAWAYSPDGDTLAVGTFVRTGVRLIDPAALRLVRDVPIPIAAVAVGWVDDRRVAVLLQKGGVVLVDAHEGRIERQRRLSYGRQCEGRRHATTPSGVVFVIAGGRGGAVRLVRLDAAGELRAVTLPRARARSTARTCSSVGFAIDASGARAIVAAPQGPIAEVDVPAMSVRTRAVRGLPRGLRSRASCRRGGCTGRRSVEWLDGDTVAIAGSTRDRAAGAALIDTASWSAQVIDRRAAVVAALDDGGVLSFGGGAGLRATALDGTLLWSALHRTRVRAVAGAGAGAGDRLYALEDPPRATRILDARTGAPSGTAPPLGRLDVLTGREEAYGPPRA